MNNIHGKREEEKCGNNEAVMETNAFGEKLMYMMVKFDHQNYIARRVHNSSWYDEKLKNIECSFM